MVVTTQESKKLRVKPLGETEYFCQFCNEKTTHKILKNQPTNWFVLLAGIPIPIPYRWKYDVLLKCNKCNKVNFIFDKKTSKELNKKYENVKGKFKKEDIIVPLQLCDVCYFENKTAKEASMSMDVGLNIRLYLCKEHKDWQSKDVKILQKQLKDWYNSQKIKNQ